MTSQDKWLLGLRIFLLMYFLVAAFMTATALDDNGVRAPLLTLTGGAVIIVVLFPVKITTVENVSISAGTTLGTAIAAIGGAGAWFLDATTGQTDTEYLIFLTTFVLLVSYLFISLIVFALTLYNLSKDR